jgi:hypothetical protein
VTRKYTRPSPLPRQLRTDERACEHDLEISDFTAVLAAPSIPSECRVGELAIANGFTPQQWAPLKEPVPGPWLACRATAVFGLREQCRSAEPARELHSRVSRKMEWRSDESKVRFILRPSHLFF